MIAYLRVLFHKQDHHMGGDESRSTSDENVFGDVIISRRLHFNCLWGDKTCHNYGKYSICRVQRNGPRPTVVTYYDGSRIILGMRLLVMELHIILIIYSHVLRFPH